MISTSKKSNFGKFFIVLPVGVLLIILTKFNTSSVNQYNYDTFDLSHNKKVELNETSEMADSKDTIWWVNSGGRAYFENNIIKTIQGSLLENDYWRIQYKNSNPEETDNGYHPQNIFRLINRNKYNEVIQSVYFRINRYILSENTHRSASNGVLLFLHYQNEDNLYYAGLRVDGYAVIKKKINGIYHTLAYSPIYTQSKYDRDTLPNLIQEDIWFGIKTELSKLGSSSLKIRLYIDRNESGNWELVSEIIDGITGRDGRPILGSGHVGIRSDFMDVEFRDYKVQEIADSNLKESVKNTVKQNGK